MREAAKLAGISDTRYRQLESGVETVRGQKVPTRTTPAMLRQVAKAFKLSGDELVRLAEEAQQGVEIGGETVEMRAALEVSGLTPTQIAKVQSYIRFLLSGQEQEIAEEA